MSDSTITLIANIINGVGLFFVVLSMVFKKKRQIIFCQGLNQIFSGIAYLMLKGYPGLMLCIVTLIMDIFIFFDKQNKTTSIIFASLTFLLGTLGVVISANSTWTNLNNGSIETSNIYKTMTLEVIIAYLPVLGTSAYNIATLKKDLSLYIMRFTFMVSCLLWAIFSIHIKSYVGFGFNIAAILVYLVRTITLRIDEKKKENNNENNNA